jgi:hypothetical protein
MAEDLPSLWRNISLSKEESLEVEEVEVGMHDIVDRGRSCLVGKLFAGRIIGKDALNSTLIKGWKPLGSTSFKVLGDNFFLMEFEHGWDKSLVLEGQP